MGALPEFSLDIFSRSFLSKIEFLTNKKVYRI